MLSGKSQASTTPTALGSLVQASTYGATIPVIYGMTLSPLLAIWAANLRQGGSTKKFKQLKKGITAYVENIDFLLGHNPIFGVQQLWINGANIPLEFTSVTFSSAPPWTITDPAFYAVIGATAPIEYSVDVNDYGGTGPNTISGTYDAPLWNILVNGPDPTDSGAFRYYPLIYAWEPSYGNVVRSGGADEWWFLHQNITIYYSKVTDATSNQGPLAHNRLAFEPELGSGSEYADAGLSTQQIIYPMFAGLGSSDIDLGSSGALPQLQAEVQGKFGTYATGDCDFADMIEDIVKSGIAQAAIGAGSTQTLTAVEHGLSCYDFPGCVQKIQNGGVEAFTVAPCTYPMNVTAGNFLVVVAYSSIVPLTISDSLSNTWTPIFSPGVNFQVWYAQANSSGVCTVTIGNTLYSWQIVLLEVAGVDAFDSASVGVSGVSVDSTVAQGLPAYLLNINIGSEFNAADPQNPLWPTVISNDNFYQPFPASASTTISGATASAHVFALERRVYAPGTYSIQQNDNINLLPQACCLLAFKCINPPSYPRPVGDFMDLYSLNLVRQQCRANGLYGSLSMNSQQSASDWLETLYDAADAAPVYAGFQLFSMPYSEVSAVGNGAVYNALTAAGPSFNLTTENGDFVPGSSDPPIKVTTAARVDQDNVLQMQCLNRTSNYNPSVVEQPDAVGISLFGVRKGDPVVNNAVQDVSIARQLLGIQVRKLQYGGDSITFSVPAKWCLLCPMGAGGGGTQDAVLTVSDPLASIYNLPVRITSISEQTDGSLQCEAELFVYGMYAPSPFTATTPQPYQGNPNTPVAGAGINPPIIFEATPALAGQASPAQLWIVTSCPAENYGGCVPYISTDGGLSYQVVGDTTIMGSAAQGVVVGNGWPAHADPDTSNSLQVNLTESLEPLADYSDAQRDNFQVPVYVGYSPIAGANAQFSTGDPAQVTALGVLYSDPVLRSVLPADAVVANIFPVIIAGTYPADVTTTTNAFYGSGLTPTSGGTNMLNMTGVIAPPFEGYGVAGIGSSLSDLVGAEIRYELGLSASGGIGATGKVQGAGWAILYSSATPYTDGTLPPPFDDPPPSGFGWAWAMPNTVTTATVGTGSNASVTANGGVAPAGVGYELITYSDAVLIGANVWDIEAGAGGVPTIVQGGEADQTGVTAVHVTLTGVAEGNSIFVSFICGQIGAIISDDQENTYTLISEYADIELQSAFISTPSVGGSCTISAVVSTNDALCLQVLEIQGLISVGGFSTSSPGSSAASIAVDSASLVLSLGAASNPTSTVSTWTNDAGWTNETTSAGIAAGNIASMTIGSAGTATNTPTPSPSALFTPQSMMVAFSTTPTAIIRRGVFGAPIPEQGMAHPFSSPFGVLNPNGQGLLKVNMPPAWIGTPLFFKFPNFNNFGAAIQDLADADVYTYTPTGIAGNIGPSTSLLVNGA